MKREATRRTEKTKRIRLRRIERPRPGIREGRPKTKAMPPPQEDAWIQRRSAKQLGSEELGVVPSLAGNSASCVRDTGYPRATIRPQRHFAYSPRRSAAVRLVSLRKSQSLPILFEIRSRRDGQTPWSKLTVQCPKIRRTPGAVPGYITRRPLRA